MLTLAGAVAQFPAAAEDGLGVGAELFDGFGKKFAASFDASQTWIKSHPMPGGE